MKKLLYCVIGLMLVFGLSACDGGSTPIDIDESLLYGTWQEGSVYERYYASSIDFMLPNGDTVQVNGTTWDVADDISEDEAQAFNWTLTGATLIHEHVATYVTVPKVYTITSLTSNELVYEENYENMHDTHRLSKVN